MENWIKVGAKVMWFDPAVDDYTDEEYEELLNTEYEIFEIEGDIIRIAPVGEVDSGCVTEVYEDEIEPYY
jgi:hypothetical protein